MKLKYIGRHTPIVVMIKNYDGGFGMNINTNDIFECPPEEAVKLMGNFPGKFIDPNEDIEEKKPGRKKKISEENKMEEVNHFA